MVIRELPVPSEHEEQTTLLAWAGTQLVRFPDLRWLAAVPNGGKRSRGEAGKMKAEGVRRGYPDLLLDVARGGFFGLRLELKRRRDGWLSDEQRAWAQRLEAQGYYYCVAYGWNDASARLIEYLRLAPTQRHRRLSDLAPELTPGRGIDR